ncbi:MAG: hypothetical protein ABSA40_06230 [Candidatus Dormibacteria bacterium]|jgi:hypothetical protein
MTLAVGVNLVVATFASAASTGNGWWWGSDSNYPTASGSYPVLEPQNGSNWYGGYFAEVGGYWMVSPCNQSGRADNTTDVASANENWIDSGSGSQSEGVMGTALYYFTGGPGADPNYNGTTSEAYNWGVAQAENAVNEFYSQGPNVATEVMVLDMDTIFGSGWNDVDYRCDDGAVKSYGVAVPLDEETFDGFWNYIAFDTPFWMGVYTSPSIWNYTFDGAWALPDNTLEWTNQSETASPSGPSPWCTGSVCAQWFGGQSSDLAFAWQYTTPSAGDSYGDFDAIDTYTFYYDEHCVPCE